MNVILRDFEQRFLPKHNCGLSLEHNRHKNYYQTVMEFEETTQSLCGNLEWVSEEQRQKAIATDEMWELHWYPDTPVGFCRLFACDLDVLLEAASK